MFGGLMIIELSIKQGLCLCYNRLCGSRVSRSSVHTLPSRTDQSGAPYVSNAPVITKSSWSIMRGDVECKRARRGGIYIYSGRVWQGRGLKISNSYTTSCAGKHGSPTAFDKGVELPKYFLSFKPLHPLRLVGFWLMMGSFQRWWGHGVKKNKER